MYANYVFEFFIVLTNIRTQWVKKKSSNAGYDACYSDFFVSNHDSENYYEFTVDLHKFMTKT